MIRLKTSESTKSIVRVRQKKSVLPREMVAVKVRQSDGSVKTLHQLEYYPREPIPISTSIIGGFATAIECFYTRDCVYYNQARVRHSLSPIAKLF